MISNNILSDRLNAFKRGEDVDQLGFDEVFDEVVNEQSIDNINYLVALVFAFGKIVAESLIFGYAAYTIFQAPWNFLGIAAVGFATYSAFEVLRNIFTKRN